MIPIRTIAAALVSAAPIAFCWPAPLAAQAMIQSLEPNDADRLATQMRVLATNPQNVDALATAGELSLRLGDLSGAAALFARADKVDPRNGRIKAGMASVLVRSERPGEALRFFGQAAGYGWPVDRFAADRGLAYDLIGQNDRAHADYRAALARGRDDETVRRYALSLGIAGRRAEALAQLDPLVRRQDRAGWRAQAFVLAMTGDTPGASKIATAMMPAAMNQGLGAFFQRLPTLSPTDRAFAVHFGEIYATPERLADARLVPALPPLTSAGTTPPVRVAAATRQDDRRAGERRRAVQVAQGAPLAPAVRMAAPREVVQILPGRTVLPPPTQSTAAAATTAPQAMREPDVRVAATSAPVPPPPAPTPVAVPVTIAATTPPPAAPSAAAPSPVGVVATPPSAAITAVAPVASSSSTERADSVLARIVANLSIPANELGIAPVRPDPAPVPVPAAVEHAPASSTGNRVVAEASAKEARDVAVRRVVAARVTGDPAADEPGISRARHRGGTAVETAAEEAPAKTPPRRTVLAKADDSAVERAARNRKDHVPATTGEGTDGRSRTRRGARAAEVEDAAPEPKPLDAKAKRAADRKALADRKAAADKKALAEQAAAEKKAARANPSRIWVQVAGGANQDDLGKAWNGAKAKAPALAGRKGYVTPLRATNRVLTGPFKTDAEARAFVNQLRKQGVAGFAFTSDAGQEVTRLGGK